MGNILMIKHPLVRYHGSKWRIAPWIISCFPKHEIYVEPFGGSGSVLLRKERSRIEVYNDLDGEIVNLFQVVRDHGKELSRLIYLTPYSRSEYIKSFELTNDPIEKARRTLTRSFQGWGSGCITNVSGGKIARPENGFCIDWRVKKGGNRNHNWLNVPDTVMNIIERLQGVVIEELNYKDVIKKNDTKKTLFYIDPPYLSDVRDMGNDYRHEFTTDDHVELAGVLNTVKGSVIVSGYDSKLYKELYRGWKTEKHFAYTAGNTKREEIIWIKI
jgi:DNA adenine methylase